MINPGFGEFCLPCAHGFSVNTARLGAFYILMTTRLFAAVGLCFVLVSRFEGAGAQQAEPLDPAVVIGLVQSFYDQTKSLQADFEQTRYTRVYDRYDRATGKVVFKKPGMMRWDYAQPNGQVFVSNGKKLLIYQPPEEGEKNGQLIERALDQDQLPSAFSFLIGSGNLEKDFEVRLLEHDNEKFQGGSVLQLIPRRPTPNYEQLVFYVRTITTNGRRAGIVQRVLIIDSAGNRNRFDFANIKFNRDVPDKRFSYRPPRGTQTVKP
jgi:outer membrane lipoprotein carrier protein